MQIDEACAQHQDEIQALVFELFPIAQLYALEAEPAYMQHYMRDPVPVQDVLQRVLEYSASVATAVPSLEMARKEFDWRNGFFVWRQPTPLHVQLLKQAGCEDLLLSAAKHEAVVM